MGLSPVSSASSPWALPGMVTTRKLRWAYLERWCGVSNPNAELDVISNWMPLWSVTRSISDVRSSILWLGRSRSSTLTAPSLELTRLVLSSVSSTMIVIVWLADFGSGQLLIVATSTLRPLTRNAMLSIHWFFFSCGSPKAEAMIE